MSVPSTPGVRLPDRTGASRKPQNPVLPGRPGRSAATIRGPDHGERPFGPSLDAGCSPGRQFGFFWHRQTSGLCSFHRLPPAAGGISVAARPTIQILRKKIDKSDRSVLAPARREAVGRCAGERRGFPPFRRRRARIRLCRPVREYQILCRIISISENNLHPTHWNPVNFSNGVNRLSGVQMVFLRFIEPSSCFRKISSKTMTKKKGSLLPKNAHFDPYFPPRSRAARRCRAGRAGKPRRSTSPAGPPPVSPSSRSSGKCRAAPHRPRHALRSGWSRRCARRQ